MTAQAGDTAHSLSRSKTALRQSLRQLRRTLPRAERRRAADRAAQHLARACRRWGARHVAVYLALAEEIDTAPLLRLLRRQGCTLFAPKIAGAHLRWAPLAAGGALDRNRYGIAEPRAVRRPLRLDLVVLPLVAFDATGARLGMGGGFYDRLLARRRSHRRPLRVGLAFAAQEVAAVPRDARDVPLDAIATERGVRRFGKKDLDAWLTG